jgi:hypothetical protein
MVSKGFPALVTLGETYYMNADMIPDVLPKVSCIPVAVVLLPYRGLLFGSCLNVLDSYPSYHGKKGSKL